MKSSETSHLQSPAFLSWVANYIFKQELNETEYDQALLEAELHLKALRVTEKEFIQMIKVANYLLLERRPDNRQSQNT
jgi:hypothetical protein